MYDEFGFPIEFTEISSPDGASTVPEPEEYEDLHVPIRQAFPAAGVQILGGESDGWEYRTFFSGANLEKVFGMVRQFLQEEGYGDVPLPASAVELRLFKKPRVGQQQLFGEVGYCHNPIKIIFPTGKDKRKGLLLCLYNEKAPDHLLRFHGLKP